ncbi:acyltransferase domain-containing protein, partial [Myxococcota bacterium]|nr:acyltransferase domain-containing protein [Myxococcota bacterium]
VTPAPRAEADGRVAIIGMACRFPGGLSLDEYAETLRLGVSRITGPPPGRWPGVNEDDPALRGGFLHDIGSFCPEAFGLTERDALLMDPQQRLFLQVAAEALDHAGQGGRALRGRRVGVYVGARSSGYHQAFYPALKPLLEGGADIATARGGVVGSMTNYIAAHVSHHFDLRGPDLVVDTACSSALVAVWLAIQALRDGACELALVGGVELKVTPLPHQHLGRMRALSDDGACRVFDERASGFVPGEGAGAVLLKPLAAALADGDPIFAVINGAAVNNDGRTMGLTTPSVEAQEAVLEAAWADAALDPDSLGYVEAHGTGTPLGDPVEVRALTRVFRRKSAASGRVALGSVKAQLGHLDTAAGIASLIKVALCLSRGFLPPTRTETPNPRFGFVASPFYLNDAARPWTTRRTAGVSSFGFGGTNAHVVLEAPPAPPEPSPGSEGGPWLFAVSAASPETFTEAQRRLSALPASAQASRSLLLGRAHGPTRRAVVLSAGERLPTLSPAPTTTRPTLVLAFPGQGAQTAGMGLGLDRRFPAFREALDRLDRLAAPALGRPLRALLADGAALGQTEHTQPALIAVELALGALFRALGVRPDALIGHSLGEYAAAAYAGVWSDEDALLLAIDRGRLMSQRTAPGAMLAVMGGEALLHELVAARPEALAIAAMNAPGQHTLSGEPAAVEDAARSLEANGARVARLSVSRAFHSPLLEPMRADWEARIRQVNLSRAKTPIATNLDGALRTQLDHDYFWRALRGPVRFAQGVESLRALGRPLLLVELGPGRALGRLSGEQALATLGADEARTTLEAVAALYELGLDLDLTPLVEGQPRGRAALPSSPSPTRRFWPAAAPQTAPPVAAPVVAAPPTPRIGPLLERRLASGPGFVVYGGALSAATDPALGDHVVLGQPILPAVGYWELVVSAAEDCFQSAVAALSRVSILEPLTAPAQGARSISVRLDWTTPGSFSFEVSSVDDAEAPPAAQRWRAHARGEGRLGQEPPRHLDIDALRQTAPLTLPVGATYAADYSERSGIHYGPFYRSLGAMSANERQVIAELALPPGVALAGWRVQPSLMDGALQSVAALRLQLPESDDCFLPLLIDEVRFGALPTPSPAIAVATVPKAPGPDDELLRMDIQLCAPSGEVVVDVRGLSLKRVPRRALMGPATETRAFAPAEPGPSGPRRVWLVVGAPR